MKNVVISADPYVLFDEKTDTYYCYSTNDGVNKAFSIHKSKNLLDWEFVDYALDLNHKNIWGKDWFWAPECYYNPNNQHYYLFYSARVKDELACKYFNDSKYEETCKIGVAVSKSPTGPFINITNEPMDYSPYDFEYLNVKGDDLFTISNNKYDKEAKKGNYIPAIDANLYFENDRIVLYFSRCCYCNCRYDEEFNRYIEASNVACVELDTEWWYDPKAESMPKIKDEYITYDNGRRKDKFITLISYQNEPQAWENAHIDDYKVHETRRKNRRWSEGSTLFPIIKDGKKVYCITYSCNCYEDEDYAVGIAYSDNLLGPFKKDENNPIIKQEPNIVCSTGHGSLIIKENKMLYFLHARLKVGEPRILCLTELNLKDKVGHNDIKICQLIDKT